jgi:hypothetical protein
MAIPFLNNIDLDDNQLQNAKLHVTSSAPASEAGQIYYKSDVGEVRYYDGISAAWVTLAEGTVTSVALSMPAAFSVSGSPITSSGTFTVTGAGTNAQVILGDGTLGSYTVGTVTSVSSGAGIVITGTAADPIVGVDYIGSDNYILSGGASTTAAAADTISFSDSDDSNVKQTTFGAIPMAALTLVKTYVDNAVAGGLVFQGSYNAATNTPNLDTTSNIAVSQGDTYVVSADGSFFTEQVRVGDLIIAQQDIPASDATNQLSYWVIVEQNQDLASLTTVGIGNVNAATASDLLGINVSYTSGTAFVGLDIDGLTTSTLPTNSEIIIPYFDDPASTNHKAALSDLIAAANSETSYAVTISATATITHNLGTRDVIIQLYDNVTYETVYADVDRINTTQATITFATTPSNNVRVLVQKIG